MPIKQPVSLHCPRCGNKQLIVYKDTFDCPPCKSEFEIKDLEQFDDDQIMSIEEKKRISEELE